MARRWAGGHRDGDRRLRRLVEDEHAHERGKKILKIKEIKIKIKVKEKQKIKK